MFRFRPSIPPLNQLHRSFWSFNSAPTSGPAMVEHVESKMLRVPRAVFSAYPLVVRREPGLLSAVGSFFFPPAGEYSPDLAVFALDHPSFGGTSEFSAPLEQHLPTIREAYGDFRVGDSVIVVEPQEGRVVKMELTEIGESECKVALQGGAWVHSGTRSERVVPSDSIWGGFPCTVLLPSTPIRILKRDVAGANREDRCIWPGPIDPEQVRFELNGEVLDEEVGVGRLMAWAASYDNEVIVRVGGERVPWVAPTHT